MEKIPSRENIIINKDKIIEVIKEKGIEDAEARELFDKWLDNRQAEVEKKNTSKATLDLNIEIAEIYRDSAMIEAAIDAFHDAASQAWNEGDDELYEKLIDEIEKLEKSIQEK